MRTTTLSGMLLISSAIMLGGCGGAPGMLSGWSPGDITIDGANADWSSGYETFADERIDVGVSNDAENLYLSLVASDRETLGQIMRQGLVIWFDGDGERVKDFGIHYPLGVMDGGAGIDMKALRRQMDMSYEEREKLMRGEFAERLEQLEIKVIESGGGRRMNRGDLAGASLAAEVSLSRFSYELKIPLREGAGTPYAIGCAPGDRIAICIQTPKIELPDRGAMAGGRGGMGGGRGGMGGGRGGMGGGPPGGMGGGRGGMAMPDPIEQWIEITLSDGPHRAGD